MRIRGHVRAPAQETDAGRKNFKMIQTDTDLLLLLPLPLAKPNTKCTVQLPHTARSRTSNSRGTLVGRQGKNWQDIFTSLLALTVPILSRN